MNGPAGTWRLIAVMWALIAPSVHAQRVTDNWNASITVASDLFNYGLSQISDGPAWRAAFDYQHPDGFFAGSFINNVDYATERNWSTPRRYVLALYGGYQSRGPDWSVYATLSHYRYPGIAISYDYTVVSSGAAYRDRYFVNVSHSRDWLGFGDGGTTYDFGFAQPLGWDLELGVNLGRAGIDSYADGRFTFWDVGLSKVVDRFAVDLRYHQNTSYRPTWLGDPGGNRVALSVAYAIAPRAR